VVRKRSASFPLCAGLCRRVKVPDGGWLSVHQWNFSNGNQPDAEFPTLRVALDNASTTIAIQLLGNDAHHGAFNSAALARAKNNKGTVVGLSKATLAGDFCGIHQARRRRRRRQSEWCGERGCAQARTGSRHAVRAVSGCNEGSGTAAVSTQRRRHYGLHGRICEAAIPGAIRRTRAEGKLTARATLAQFYDPEEMRTRMGKSTMPGWWQAPNRSARNTRGPANPRRRRQAVGRRSHGR